MSIDVSKGTYRGVAVAPANTANRTYEFPDASGTVVLGAPTTTYAVPQRAVLAEFTGVAVPAQSWFDGLVTAGYHGFHTTLWTFAGGANGVKANDAFDKARAAGLWIGAYWRPVDEYVDALDELSTANAEALVNITMDVEPDADYPTVHPLTPTIVAYVEAFAAAQPVPPSVMIYSNWGLWGDVMGYTTEGYQTTPLWMRELTASEPTTWGEAPVLPYQWFGGWTTRRAQQWDDPVTIGGEATALSIFDPAMCGLTYEPLAANPTFIIPAIDDLSSMPHDHGSQMGGGSAIGPLTEPLEVQADVTIVTDATSTLKVYFTSGQRSILLGTIDAVHTSTTEGLEIGYSFAAARAFFEAALYGTGYRAMHFKGLSATFNMGTSGAEPGGDIFRVDTTGIAFKPQGATNWLTLLKAADGGNRTMIFPDLSDTVVTLTATQALTNKAIDPAGTTIGAIVVPAFQGNAAGTQTTSGTTQLNVQTITITNPPVAGQIHITAFLNLFGATVAADTFQVKLWFGTTPTEIARATWVAHATDLRGTITLVGAAAVANSGTQLIRMSVTRTGGTGTVSIIGDGLQGGIQWIIVPGAGTTA